MALRIFTVFSLVCLISCADLETKKIAADDLLAEEWNAINLHEVTTYPAYSACNTKTTDAAKKRCFEQHIHAHFYSYLGKQPLVVTTSFKDTVWVALHMDKEGVLAVDSIRAPRAFQQEIPDFEQYIHEASQQLPKAFPATKNGVPVKVKFELPIVLYVD